MDITLGRMTSLKTLLGIGIVVCFDFKQSLKLNLLLVTIAPSLHWSLGYFCFGRFEKWSNSLSYFCEPIRFLSEFKTRRRTVTKS